MRQPPAGSSARKPAVLFVSYTYTQQTLTVAEEMADVLRGRGCDVHLNSPTASTSVTKEARSGRC